MVLVYLKKLLFPHERDRNPHGEERFTKYGALGRGFPDGINEAAASRESCDHGQQKQQGDDEKHASLLSPRLISDAIIGLSDGLTVPFALTAGLSTFNDTRVVVYGGLAELIAGSISMGLGGWLAARGEHEYYMSTSSSIKQIIKNYHSEMSRKSPSSRPPSPPAEYNNVLLALNPSKTTATNSPLPKILISIFEPYSLPPETLLPVLRTLLSPVYPREKLASFIMRFKHTLSPPNANRATISALTIALGYFFGGFVPLLPYFFVARTEVIKGLYWSVGAMAVCLAVFGWWKTSVVAQEQEEEFVEEIMGAVLGDEEEGEMRRKKGIVNWEQVGKNAKGALQMVLIGGLAAGAAMGIVKFFGGTAG